MGCCDDPTEPEKINRVDLARAQEQYGNLLRDLLTSDPEKLMLKQLHYANTYLIELAALNAYYESVNIAAINKLESKSIPILQQVIDKEKTANIVDCAKSRISALENDKGVLSRLFN